MHAGDVHASCREFVYTEAGCGPSEDGNGVSNDSHVSCVYGGEKERMARASRG
jgi:hypothetical protein